MSIELGSQSREFISELPIIIDFAIKNNYVLLETDLKLLCIPPERSIQFKPPFVDLSIKPPSPVA